MRERCPPYIGSLGAGVPEDVGVDGRRGGGGRMTQRASYGSDGTLLFNHQRGRLVAQVMQVNVREIVSFFVGFVKHTVIVGPFEALFRHLLALAVLKSLQAGP